METHLLTAVDIGRRYNVTAQTVMRWYRAGLVPGVKITRGTVRFDPQAVDQALMAEPEGRPPDEPGRKSPWPVK